MTPTIPSARWLGRSLLLVAAMSLVATACSESADVEVQPTSANADELDPSAGDGDTVVVDPRGVDNPLEELGLLDEDGCVQLARPIEEVQAFLDGMGFDNVSVASAVEQARRDGIDRVLAENNELVERFGETAVKTLLSELIEPPAAACPAGQEGGDEPGVVAGGASDRVGYYGPHFRDEVTNRTEPTLLVVDGTVAAGVDSAGQAVVRGLAVNDSPVAIGAATITVSIGTVTAQGDLILPLVYPGEPAPFEVAVGGDADEEVIPDVRFSAIEPATEASDDRRAFDIDPVWQLPGGDRRERAEFASAWEEPAEPPYPAVWFGAVRSEADGPVRSPMVTLAWLDADGAVVDVDTFPVLSGGRAIDEMPPDGNGDYVVVVDSGDPELESATLAIWGWAP